MKCEKCNGKEANYFYKETVNGKTTERHLCMDCAREEGLDKAFDWSGESLFRGFEDMFGGFFGADPWEEFFPLRRMPGLGRTMLAPWRMVFPVIQIERTAPDPARAESEAAPEAKAEPDAELSRQRERNALRQQMEEAARAEDYERAIELRDKLRSMDE